jgi:hypothetical protein
MEKRKIDLSAYYDVHEEETFEGKDGTKVTVRNHIPYMDKEAIAGEMAGQLLIIHDESCMYTSKDIKRKKLYMIAKYYTDIDVEEADEHQIADFLINNDLADQIENYVFDDWYLVEQIYLYIEKAVIKTYEDDKSLSKAIKTSFSSLLTGEDVGTTLANAEHVRDTLMDAVEALRQVNKEKEEQIDHGKMTVGGNVINFAKRKDE